MYLTTINATKIARQIQLCQTYICRKSNARRAFSIQKVSINSSSRNSSTIAFYQNNFLRKRFANRSVLISVPKRSLFVVSRTVADKSEENSRVLSQFAYVRDFIGEKTFSTVNSGAFSDNMTKIPFQRLPAAVVPKHYNLELQPDLIAFTFAGNVSIQVQVM